MAGHSKFANIRHRKDAVDKKRAKIFTKIARKLIVEARLGGPDPVTNASLRLIVDMARAANMPKDVIQRNIDKGAGVGADAAAFEELIYEGYGPGGVAMMIDILTDNRNRTAPEIKKIFERANGNMGEPGCVAYNFNTRAVFAVKGGGKTEDDVMETVMEADVEDIESADGDFVIIAEATAYMAVKELLDAADFEVTLAEIQRLPQTEVDVTDEDQAAKILKLVDALEDHDDVQRVSSNFNISDDLYAKLQS